MIAENLKSVTRRISRCCEKTGRSVGEVELVCVTKMAAIEQMEEALAAGVKVFGENRVQDAQVKHKAIGDRVSWHLIGHLQTNKAKDAVRIFSLIHSVDSLHLAEEIDKQASRLGKIQDILVQVNTSLEASKFGIRSGEAGALLKQLALYRNISVKGLMTIAPEVVDHETVRPYFRELRELKDKMNSTLNTQYRILSMGMTNDFEVAIEEGSTMVRVGRAIFR